MNSLRVGHLANARSLYLPVINGRRHLTMHASIHFTSNTSVHLAVKAGAGHLSNDAHLHLSSETRLWDFSNSRDVRIANKASAGYIAMQPRSWCISVEAGLRDFTVEACLRNLASRFVFHGAECNPFQSDFSRG